MLYIFLAYRQEGRGGGVQRISFKIKGPRILNLLAQETSVYSC
jgi:hypothetical protein